MYMARLTQLPQRILMGVLMACAGTAAMADATADVVVIPDYSVVSANVANPEPVGNAATPVSALRFEPRVDVQARNLAENQADISIRGGTFENSGFRLGALLLSDPQTGHYLAEIPVSPFMLGVPQVLTGLDNAMGGFGANAGTVAYSWRPIDDGGELSLAGGNYHFGRASLYMAEAASPQKGGPVIASDVEWSRSRSDGSVPYGDQAYERVGARFQVRTANTQTDFIAGYQHKFFGWPDLYTPFGVNETENLQTVLLAANTRWQQAGRGYLEVGVFYRRNKDDYEYNRFVPGQFNPYQHTTWARGGSLQGRRESGDWAVNYSVEDMHDNLSSTALVFGPYASRDQLKAVFAPERILHQSTGQWKLQAGGAYDDSNRGGEAFSPLSRVEWQSDSGWRAHLEYSGASQLPTYTALKSSPASGLFRGNQSLGRERSRNLEFGAAAVTAGWSFETAIFHRQDDALVDWTYRRGVTARTANPVDIGTLGLELVARHHTAHTDWVVGYTRLRKDANYGSSLVDASFYAMNFPQDRLTSALTWRLGHGWELRSDNQYRREQPNLLRTTGGNSALLSSIGLHFAPDGKKGWDYSLRVDNLWDSSFQEVPAVPAPRRQVAAEISRHW